MNIENERKFDEFLSHLNVFKSQSLCFDQNVKSFTYFEVYYTPNSIFCMFSIATDREDSVNKSLSGPIKTRKKGKHVKKEVSDPSLLKCK